MKRKPYPTDLTNDEGKIIEGLIPGAKPGGHLGTVEIREVLTSDLLVIGSG